MIWFTADPHFGHKKVIEFSKRPWTTVEEMDAALIKNWNSRVGKKEEIYLIGDFSFHKDQTIIRNQLNGRIHLIIGNHDRRRISLLDTQQLFESVQDVKYLRFNKLRFFLSHYPHRCWPKSGKGSFHLYGHTHGDYPGVGKSMDVGVDANDYLPVSMDEVILKLKDKPDTPHHLEKK